MWSMQHSNNLSFTLMNLLFSLLIQRFCSWFGLPDCAPGAAAVYFGLCEVDLPGSGSPGGSGAQPVLLLQEHHHSLHPAVSISPRGQCVHRAVRRAGAAGDGGREARAAGVLFPGWWTSQAGYLPPVQPAERRTLEQTHDGLQIRAAGQQESCSHRGPQRAAEWVDLL